MNKRRDAQEAKSKANASRPDSALSPEELLVVGQEVEAEERDDVRLTAEYQEARRLREESVQKIRDIARDAAREKDAAAVRASFGYKVREFFGLN